MFVGHLPAGYLLARRLSLGRAAFWALLAGSLFPDLDMLYFYLIDRGQHLHHSYPTHLPAVWLMIAALCEIVLPARARVISRSFVAGILLHLMLDTIVGGVRWLWPISSREIFFFHVPARYDWWVMSFVMHWTFLFEIIVIVAALIALWSQWRAAALACVPAPRNTRSSGNDPPALLSLDDDLRVDA